MATDSASRTTRELAQLTRTYGGVLGAIEYGVQSDSIMDPEVASAWRRIEQQYAQLRPNLAIVGRVLRAADGDRL